MGYTYQELREKTVAELREIASGIEHEAVRGHTQMNKARLLAAICEALGIEMRERHQVVGIDKTVVKAQIKALKAKRAEAMAARDYAGLRVVRRKIHYLKRQLRKATV